MLQLKLRNKYSMVFGKVVINKQYLNTYLFPSYLVLTKIYKIIYTYIFLYFTLYK